MKTLAGQSIKNREELKLLFCIPGHATLLVPANIEPIMTQLAPKEMALIMCPTLLIPPSAITGTPNFDAYFATR